MRLRSIDWLRGLAIVLMTVDHAGSTFDSAHMHGDSAARWIPGSPLPPAEFLTRWVTHLCAPAFVLLAGTSLALSLERRGDQPGQTRFIVTRGLLIAALDPLWMSLAWGQYERIVLQVLYAIGLSMVCMAFLRRLSTRVLLGTAIAIQLLGELTSFVHPESQPWKGLWALLFVGGNAAGRVRCPYPLVPWLSIMIIGWVLGRWLLQHRRLQERVGALAFTGASLLALFGLVRWLNGYGNWGLLRDSDAVLQWLHVAKYPPSLSFTSLELGIVFLLLAAFVQLDDPDRPRRALVPLALFGSTALFYYVLHVHLMVAVNAIAGLDPDHAGLLKTWLGAAATVAVLAGPTLAWRRYKSAHPDGWARFV